MEVAKSWITEWPYNGYVLLGTVTAGISLWMARRYFAGGVCRSKAMLDGKTVIITGGNTGIGKETAIDLAKRNARIIVACRSQEKGKKAEVDIRRESGSSDVHFHQMDLSSFQSIRKFAKEVLSEESRIDILINNAGVMYCPFGKTEDGFETQFGVNHLGHFLLTNLLLDKIKQAPEGRIVVVSSIGHTFASKLDLDTINSEAHYSPYDAYHESKLANVLFTKALAKRLVGTNVTANSLHPGGVNTELQRHTSAIMVSINNYHTYITINKFCMYTSLSSVCKYSYNTGKGALPDTYMYELVRSRTQATVFKLIYNNIPTECLIKSHK